MCFNPCRAGLVAIALLTIAPLHSQTTFASITGIVTDSTGSVVPSAQVVATNVETNIAVQSASNESGNYTIAQLQLGRYTVRVNAPGFKAFVATNVTLASRDIRRVDVSLEVGTVDSSIQVTQLQLGRYTVRVNAPGFKVFVERFCRPAAAPFVLPAAAETNRTGRSTELRWPTAWTIRRLVPC